MKKLFLIFLAMMTTMLCQAQEPVTVGKGSYAEYAPLVKSKTDEHSGDQSMYMQYRNLYIVEEAGVPIPTNDWWTDLINADRGRSGQEVTGHLWSYPQYVQGMRYGIDIHYPTYWVDNGTEMKAQSKLLVKGGDGFNALTPMAEQWSDWAVTFSESSGTKKMTTTLAHGVPFTWIELANISPAITVAKTGNDGADNVLTGKTTVKFLRADGTALASGVHSSFIIAIGNSDALKVGEWVLAVGNPFNLTSTVTAGIVSAKARSLGANGVESFIQTDAAINAGNSGGALVNERGELVGINAMLYSQTGSYSGYGFAIPTTIMNKVVKDLKEFGMVQRAMLGVRGGDVTNYIDSEKEKGNEVDLGTNTGIYIRDVEPKSAAEELGLQKGDVVTAIDGKEVTKMAELQEALSQRRPGDKVTVTYLRSKKRHTETATLRNAQGGTEVLEEVDIDLFGAQLKPLTDETRQALALRYGLEVTAIKKGKLADAGITKGMILLQVNDKEMRTVEDFEEAVKAANQSSDRVLWIRAITQSGRRVATAIDLSSEKK